MHKYQDQYHFMIDLHLKCIIITNQCYIKNETFI